MSLSEEEQHNTFATHTLNVDILLTLYLSSFLYSSPLWTHADEKSSWKLPDQSSHAALLSFLSTTEVASLNIQAFPKQRQAPREHGPNQTRSSKRLRSGRQFSTRSCKQHSQEEFRGCFFISIRGGREGGGWYWWFIEFTSRTAGKPSKRPTPEREVKALRFT